MRQNLGPFFLLVRLRWKLTSRTLLRSASALMGVLLVLAVFAPAAVAAGNRCAAALGSLPIGEREGLLRLVLLGMQAVWLLLLLPGTGAALGQSLSANVLRPFPVRPAVLVAAGAFGALLDVPLLLALPTLGAVARTFAGAGGAAWLLVLLALALLSVQTVLLGQLVEQAVALVSRQRRLSLAFVAAVALLFGIQGGLPAMAAANDAGRPKAGAPAPGATLGGLASKTAWAVVLPSGMAAQAVGAASRGAWGGSLLGLLGLTAYTGLTFAGASRLLQAASLREGGVATIGPMPRIPWPNRRRRGATADAADLPRTARHAAWEQVGTVAQTELRRLVRDPALHLPLRQPASLPFAILFAFIAPNLGPDALQNLYDLVGMGSLLYVLFWQVQLLFDRFGTEPGTSALLLSFPCPRARLILGRNLSALSLLLPVNVALIVGVTRAAEKPHLLLPMLLYMPVVLLLLTAWGNLLSVRLPYAVARRKRGFEPEPPRELAFLYLLVLGAVGWIVATLAGAFARSPWAGLGLLAVFAGLYAASVWASAWLLARREPEIIAVLDGNG